MAKYKKKYTAGNATFRVTDAEEIVRRVARASGDAALELVVDGTEKVYRDAVSRWPESREERWSPKRRASQPHHSAEGIRYEILTEKGHGTTTLVAGRVYVGPVAGRETWWAKYVSIWYMQGKNAFWVLMRKPMMDLRKKIADVMAQRLLDNLRRGR